MSLNLLSKIRNLLKDKCRKKSSLVGNPCRHDSDEDGKNQASFSFLEVIKTLLKRYNKTASYSTFFSIWDMIFLFVFWQFAYNSVVTKLIIFFIFHGSVFLPNFNKRYLCLLAVLKLSSYRVNSNTLTIASFRSFPFLGHASIGNPFKL